MKRILYAALPLLLVAGHATTSLAQDVTRYAPSVAQPRASHAAYLRASMGVTPTKNWEYRCAKLGLEYAPMLTSHLGLAGRVAAVVGAPTASAPIYGPWIESMPNQNYRAGFVEAEGLYYPLGTSHRVRFAVGLGGFAGSYTQNTFTTATIVSNELQSFTSETRRGTAVGYLGSLNLEVALGQERNWLLGLKATRQYIVHGVTNLPGQSLTLARKI